MQLLSKLNEFFWNGPLLVLLTCAHLYFTVRSKCVQRHTFRAARALFCNHAEGHSSGWSALTTTLAATLGTGNIIGMSTAIALGGPGAVFWCWITGVFGMATTYAECNLSLQHRKEAGGRFGPMHLLANVCRRPRAANFYAAALFASALLIAPTLHTRALVISACSLLPVPPLVAGLFVAALLACAIFRSGGIERCCYVLVPAMSIYFLGGCVFLLLRHAAWLPESLVLIVRSAFSAASFPIRPVAAGITGYTVGRALRHGIAKGLFTNEAGLGTATMAAVENTDSTVVEQSLFSMLAPFFDTVLLCGITGVMLVACMLADPSGYLGSDGTDYVARAFSVIPGFGDALLHVAIVVFAFATLLGWCFIGKKAAEFLGGKRLMKLYRFCYLFMLLPGSVLELHLLWELTDFLNLFLLLPNCYLLWKLRRCVTYPK